MLTLDLRVDTPKKFKTCQGDIGNVSNLRSLSSYGFYFEGRNPVSKGTLLENYPRWSESVRGIVARCLALTVIDSAKPLRLAREWRRVTLTIGLRPGGLGAKKLLCVVTVSKDLEAGDGTLTVGFEEATGMNGFQSGVVSVKAFKDVWDAAQFALSMSMWGSEDIPEAKALDIPVYEVNGKPYYIRMGDIPEPTRSIFESRMARSGRPAITGDSVFVWDWTDFLNGQR